MGGAGTGSLPVTGAFPVGFSLFFSRAVMASDTDFCINVALTSDAFIFPLPAVTPEAPVLPLCPLGPLVDGAAAVAPPGANLFHAAGALPPIGGPREGLASGMSST